MDFLKVYEKVLKQHLYETKLRLVLSKLLFKIENLLKNNYPVDKAFLIEIKNTLFNTTTNEEGLLKEEDNTKLYGINAVEYVLWKIVHSSTKENTGLNSREMLEWLKDHPEIGLAMLEGVKNDKDTIIMSKQLQKNKKYWLDSYTKIIDKINMYI